MSSSGSAALQCATTVEAFDQGVKRLLEERTGKTERDELFATVKRVRIKLGLHNPRSRVSILSTRTLPRDLRVLISPADSEGTGGPAGATLIAHTEETLTFQMDHLAVGQLNRLRDQREVSVDFFRAGDAAYNFRASVVGLREMDVPFLVVRHPKRLDRVQSRQFARVACIEKVKFRILDRKVIPVNSEEPRRPTRTSGWIRGILVDVSGTGCRMKTDEKLVKSDYIMLSLPFLPEPLNHELCTAQVLRCRDNGVHGMAFEGLSPQIQAALLQFVRRHEVQEAAMRMEPTR